jgi:Ni/Fe-hydrogenase subunit HybB-like protein
MPQENARLDLFDRVEKPVSKPLLGALVILALLGILAFVSMVTGKEPERGWEIFLVNFLVFNGISLGAIVFSAAARLSNARWDGPVSRVAQGFVAFLPVSYVMYWLVVLLGGEHLFPWLHLHDPLIEAKRGYLNMPFLMFRGGAGLLALYVAAWLWVRSSLVRDLAAVKDRLTGLRRQLAERITAGYRGSEADDEALKLRRSRIAPALVLVYVVVLTFLAFDLVMSLMPTWFSTLFGAYYFMGAWLSGLAATAIATVLLRRRFGLEDVITRAHLHDHGKLMFGFSLFWTALFWSQYIVVWYGNLPLETQFLVVRKFPIWQSLSIVVLCCLFVIPFLGLLPRASKTNPVTHFFFAAVIAVGFFLERFDLVVPSLNRTPSSFPFGLPELAVTLGFLSLFILCFIGFMRTFPIVPITGLPRKAEHSSSYA